MNLHPFKLSRNILKSVMYVQSSGFAHETNCFKRLSLSSLWLLRRKKTRFWGDYINNSDHCESTTSGIVFYSRLQFDRYWLQICHYDPFFFSTHQSVITLKTHVFRVLVKFMSTLPQVSKQNFSNCCFYFSELGCLSINIVSVMFVFSVHKTGAWTAWDQNWENGELATLWYDYDKFVSNDAHLTT